MVLFEDRFEFALAMPMPVSQTSILTELPLRGDRAAPCRTWYT